MLLNDDDSLLNGLLNRLQFRARYPQPHHELLFRFLAFCLPMLLPNEGTTANHHNKERCDRKPTHEWASHFGSARTLEHDFGETRRRLSAPQGLAKITFELAHRFSPSNTALLFP